MAHCGRRCRSATNFTRNPMRSSRTPTACVWGNSKGLSARKAATPRNRTRACCSTAWTSRAVCTNAKWENCKAGRKFACCSRRRSLEIPARCCWTSRPTTWTSIPPLAAEISDGIRRRAHRHLARPPFSEQRVHAHRGHRLRNDHHVQRRLRRHGGREDARAHTNRSGKRTARKENLAIAGIHRALFRRYAFRPGHLAQEGSRAAADDGAGEVEHSASVHQVRHETEFGKASARDSQRRKIVRRPQGHSEVFRGSASARKDRADGAQRSGENDAAEIAGAQRARIYRR